MSFYPMISVCYDDTDMSHIYWVIHFLIVPGIYASGFYPMIPGSYNYLFILSVWHGACNI